MLMERVEQELLLREPFGTWLLAQLDRGDWIDGSAAAARADRGFPERDDVDQVRERMKAQGADPAAFEVLDDAELDWFSC